ncbi:MAG TPA: sulfur carrier protein ThiS [Pseudomonadales bacterium]|nr:sulfur carrier protein ThiS [Pseudomonadales bacterium]
MQIILNGKPVEVADHTTVTALIDQLGLAGKRIAVEVNEDIVPRSAHANHILQADDRVEIVHAIGGG